MNLSSSESWTSGHNSWIWSFQKCLSSKVVNPTRRGGGGFKWTPQSWEYIKCSGSLVFAEPSSNQVTSNLRLQAERRKHEEEHAPVFGMCVMDNFACRDYRLTTKSLSSATTRFISWMCYLLYSSSYLYHACPVRPRFLHNETGQTDSLSIICCCADPTSQHQ